MALGETGTTLFVPATQADLAEVVDLANIAFRGAEGWTNENYISGQRLDEPMLREDIATKPDARLLIHRDPADGVLLGTVWLEPQPDGVWYLGLLTVRPNIQARQLGRQLLAEAEDIVRKAGGARIRMTVVNLRETLIAWYQRRGYALTGETQPFPYHDARFGTPLRDDLCFVVLEKPL